MAFPNRFSLVALSSLLLAGCDLMPIHTATKNVTAEHVSDASLDVQTANGSVQVTRADREDVRIVARLRARTPERLEAAEVVAERGTGGRLVVRVDWPEGRRQGGEGCSFDIEIPGATGVSLTSSNGSLSIEGLGGEAVMKTSNGSIKVHAHQGSVDAHSSNASLELVDVTGAVEARSSNGGIRIALAADSPGPIEASTSNASIKMELGSSFAGKLALKTSNARVKIDDLPPDVSVLSSQKTSAELDFCANDQRSSATTSNGSITVTAAFPRGDTPEQPVSTETPLAE